MLKIFNQTVLIGDLAVLFLIVVQTANSAAPAARHTRYNNNNNAKFHTKSQQLGRTGQAAVDVAPQFRNTNVYSRVKSVTLNDDSKFQPHGRMGRAVGVVRQHRNNNVYSRVKSVTLNDDFQKLAQKVKAETANSSKACMGFDSNNATELTLSPLSKNGTVLTQLKNPAEFRAEETVVYQVVQSPADVDEQSPAFAVNSNNFLFVAVDRLYDNIDLAKSYDQPSLIAINASSGSKSCIMYYTLRFFDAFFAFEPDWEASPILNSAYHFAVDCPTPKQALGRVGDETRNDIYHVKYSIANNNSSADAIQTQKLFTLDAVNGRVQTSADRSLTDSAAAEALQNTTRQFRISASAPDHRAVFSIVYVYFGVCDGKIPSTTDFDTLERYFIAKCAAVGDIIGQLPRGLTDHNFTSYVMFPSEREFSVTADGQIRVLDVDLRKPENYTLSVSAPTADGQITVYSLTIEVQPCPLSDVVASPSPTPNKQSPKPQALRTLPNLGTYKINCPYAGDLIMDLTKVNKFATELENYKRSNRLASTIYFGTNASNLVQISPERRLSWLQPPRAYIRSLAVAITAQSSNAKYATELGYVLLQRQNFVAGQPGAQKSCEAKQHLFQQTINLHCATKGQEIAYVSTSHVAPRLRRAKFDFRMASNEFFDIERTSGIVFVKQALPTTLELTVALPISVIGQSTFEQNNTVVFDGVLNVRISPCSTSGSIMSDYASNYVAAEIKCEQFDFKSASSILPIGVAVRGSKSLAPNREFVAQVFAELADEEGVGNNSMPRYRWSIEEGEKSGYSIDPYSGKIYQLNNQPNSILTVRATSTTKPRHTWCSMRLRPTIVTRIDAARTPTGLGLLNRQPPKFSSQPLHFSYTAKRCKTNAQGVKKFTLPLGFNIGRINAFDPDDGLAGAINYTLCSSKTNKNAVQSCGETLKVDISRADSVDERVTQQLYLQIDSRSGNLFIAKKFEVTESQITFQVRASNTVQPRRLFDGPRRELKFIGLPASESTDTAEVTFNLACASLTKTARSYTKKRH